MSFTNELNLFMDLRSSSPYWLLKNGIVNTYPSLQQHEKCDVAIIGAGIIGGKDIDFTTAKARDLRIKQKTTALEKSFQSLFPAIKFSTDFSWAGTFAGTKDGLPYIGCPPGKPGIYFALGFGGNGITFSAIAGEIITDLIKGKKNNNASIFKFGR